MSVGTYCSRNLNQKNELCLFLCRYQRGCRSLAANLQAQGSVVQHPVVPVDANEADDEEEYDIPGEIENVVGVLTLGRNYCNACKLKHTLGNNLLSRAQLVVWVSVLM